MHPDYNQLWRNINNDGQASDAQFYAFFEDSLNQFISTNSNDVQPAANKTSAQNQDEINKDQ